MTRRTLIYTVETDGRDKGKKFLITEMSPWDGEKWGVNCLLAFMKGGINLPQGYETTGLSGLAALGFQMFSSLDWETLEPLFNQMMKCVEFVIEIKNQPITRPLTNDGINFDIEDSITLMEIKYQVWKMHVDFLKAVIRLISPEMSAQENTDSQNT